MEDFLRNKFVWFVLFAAVVAFAFKRRSSNDVSPPAISDSAVSEKSASPTPTRAIQVPAKNSPPKDDIQTPENDFLPQEQGLVENIQGRGKRSSSSPAQNPAPENYGDTVMQNSQLAKIKDKKNYASPSSTPSLPFGSTFESRGRRACDKNTGGWFISGEAPHDYRIATESADVAFIESLSDNPRPHAELNHCANVPVLIGIKVHMKAMIKAEGIKDYANLHIRAQNQYHQWIDKENVTFKGTFDWKEFNLELLIPDETERVFFGLTFESAGKVWIKDVTFTAEEPH